MFASQMGGFADGAAVRMVADETFRICCNLPDFPIMIKCNESYYLFSRWAISQTVW